MLKTKTTPVIILEYPVYYLIPTTLCKMSGPKTWQKKVPSALYFLSCQAHYIQNTFNPTTAQSHMATTMFRLKITRDLVTPYP